jgi:Bacteriocin-protection, YdeI or OmpD-Associated
MSNQSLFEKLELKDEKTLLIQGIPSSIEKQFAKLTYAKNVTPLLKSKKVEFALVFAINQNQLTNVLKEVFPALNAASKLWIAYPKPTSKIVSDLNRDCTWAYLTQHAYEGGEVIEIDNVWVAMRFKKNEELAAQLKAIADANPPAAVVPTVDFEKRLIVPPAELEKVFAKHKKAKDFFTSLSVTHQKEYVSWIEEAKRKDTKERRLDAVLEKLNAGKKSPSEK